MGKKLNCPVTRYMHDKYERYICNTSEDMTKFKGYFDRLMDRYLNETVCPPLFPKNMGNFEFD